ncbi:HNH endonuclease [Companilactobacillus sp.]|uniref:HNH endonuclease n=1 Tax=Companilactobacillus sp. TaxID=2767905 RepID=UPI002622EE51|nr:HNH endonuclease [Companilactobacillus sp.]
MKGPVEFWKKHPDIDGIEVSSFGRVRSLKGHCYKSNLGNSGYLQVQFYMNGKHVNKSVHRLVAQTFIPNPNDLLEVKHKDGNRANNSASDLEWSSSSHNHNYMGLGRPVLAVNLTTLEVSRFSSQKEASRVLGLQQPNVNAVIKGRIKQTGGYRFENADAE